MFETCLISLEISTSSYLLCGCFFCLLNPSFIFTSCKFPRPALKLGFDIFIRTSGWLQLSICGCFNTKNAWYHKFLLNISENVNRDLKENCISSFPIPCPCKKRPLERKITLWGFCSRCGGANGHSNFFAIYLKVT